MTRSPLALLLIVCSLSGLATASMLDDPAQILLHSVQVLGAVSLTYSLRRQG
jgi:hypothetical protein